MKTQILLEAQRRLEVFDWKYDEAYIVGGVVRDLYLNRINDTSDLSSLDMDFCLCFNKQNLPSFLNICNRFLSFNTLHDCFTVPRKEFMVEDNGLLSHDYIVAKDINVDVFRRDFSVNSLYINIFTGQTIDLLNGISDCVEQKLVPINSEIFFIDPSRFIRMCRFSLQCNLSLPTTEDLTYFLLTLSYWNNFPLSAYLRHRLSKELKSLFLYDISEYIYQLLNDFFYRILDKKVNLSKTNHINILNILKM